MIDAGTNVTGYTDGYVGSAPDIGAYEFGAANYWIPGFQAAQASVPIPSSGTTGQLGDSDLIWLGGWEGTSYDIYFGTNQSAVASATRSSSEYVRHQSNNIFRPRAVSNTTCYWRIDTLTPEGTVKGDVWQLSYGYVAPPATTAFEDWAAASSLTGTNALWNADIEPDGLNNLLEYALGGNPNVDDAAVVKPGTSMAEESGTNWFYHVHNERTDDPKLNYELGQKSSLTNAAAWTSHGIELVDASVEVDSIKSVTNRTEAADNQKFLQLKVELAD